MIKVNVDESAAFDMMAIIEVKIYNVEPGSDKIANLYKSLEKLWQDIEYAIGPQKIQEVYNSQDYKNLYNANQKVFQLVDLAKIDEVTASEVDDANFSRYIYKKHIQLRHFGGPLTEVKVGYNNEMAT